MASPTAEKASWTTDASSPPALARLAPRPPAPPVRAARAAWQIGHHWHSGGSLGGTSLVAVSHTSPLSRRSAPIVRFTWPATWFAMLRAPAFISQRWKSATGSLSLDAPRPLPDWLRLPDWPLALVWPLLLLCCWCCFAASHCCFAAGYCLATGRWFLAGRRLGIPTPDASYP